MDGDGRMENSATTKKDSPATAHSKVLANFHKQVEAGWITKDEFRAHVADCNERFKDAILGASRLEGVLGSAPKSDSRGSSGRSGQKRRRIDVSDDDEEGDTLGELNKAVEGYLTKTCKTHIYISKVGNSDHTKILSIGNSMKCSDGSEVEMWKRQTRTSKTYKCTLPECARRDAFDMTADRMQKINGHNKSSDHNIKAVIKLVSIEDGWEVVPWTKDTYKALAAKHKLQRPVEAGNFPPTYIRPCTLFDY